jgi:hypothetical protein
MEGKKNSIAVKKLKIINTQCSTCDRKTNQHILFLKREKKKNEHNEKEIEIVDYLTIECAGCKTVSFLHRELYEDINGEEGFIDNHYPNNSNYHWGEFNFLSDEDQDELPTPLYNLYEEVKLAFENDSNILAGIGLRTLVEAVCLHQKIAGKNLQDKIKNLQTQGLISSAELPILDKLRLIGNMSTHQVKAIPLDKLNYALDIINHVLKSIYVLPKINRKLKI